MDQYLICFRSVAREHLRHRRIRHMQQVQFRCQAVHKLASDSLEATRPRHQSISFKKGSQEDRRLTSEQRQEEQMWCDSSERERIAQATASAVATAALATAASARASQSHIASSDASGGQTWRLPISMGKQRASLSTQESLCLSTAGCDPAGHQRSDPNTKRKSHLKIDERSGPVFRAAPCSYLSHTKGAAAAAGLISPGLSISGMRSSALSGLPSALSAGRGCSLSAWAAAGLAERGIDLGIASGSRLTGAQMPPGYAMLPSSGATGPSCLRPGASQALKGHEAQQYFSELQSPTDLAANQFSSTAGDSSSAASDGCSTLTDHWQLQSSVSPRKAAPPVPTKRSIMSPDGIQIRTSCAHVAIAYHIYRQQRAPSNGEQPM